MSDALGLVVSSAGRRVELLRCFRDDARALGIALRVVAVDLDPSWSSACAAADAAHAVPRCTDASFADAVFAVCAAEGATMVVPTLDPELAVFAGLREAWRAHGIAVVVSSREAIGLARDKAKTHERLVAHGLPTPRAMSVAEALDAGRERYPLIAKPRDGSSSIGLVRARGPEELVGLAAREDYVVEELLVGAEYTVNCYTDPAGRLVCAVPHLRKEVRAGEVSKAETVDHAPLLALAPCIAAAWPGLRGPWCFQAIETPEGRIGVLELNARFGGGYPVAHHAGAHFTRWLLEEQLGRTPDYGGGWRPGVRMLRYDAAHFVEPR